ncbi:MAG: pyruvate kinase [Candidatus Poseidoniaceae archaeon]|nr:pyruvate kinase [Candidatus Poseidoniaceae archaeon]
MRRTRIVATIGPSSDDDKTLLSLLRAGVNVCRLNYSHGEPEQKTELYQRIRQLETELGQPTCILADLPGPKLRLGEFDGIHVLTMKKKVELHCGVEYMENASNKQLPVQYAGLSAELKKGDPVLLSDGLIRLKVLSSPGEPGGIVTCRIQDGGPISARKGINVPGTMVDLPAIGPKDELALEHALDSGADLIAVSYVRSAEDLQPARDAIAQRDLSTWVIAKIEHPMALDHLDEILANCDAVMVARGDLGVEIPLEEVPIAQQKIIDSALELGMPVIVATQMLETMTVNPRPTRAEVSDVSTAIRQGATGVMLSGETASGKYPVESVQTMSRIAASTEQGLQSSNLKPESATRFKSTRAVAHAGVELAKMAGASRILVATERGNAPRLVSSYRPGMPVTAVTDSLATARRIQILSGVDSVIVEEYERGSKTMQNAIALQLDSGKVQPGDKIVAISGSPKAISGLTSTARLYKISDSGEIVGTE